ncbi:MAG TPA: hypothetical protein VKC60_05920 [Opitutaceae bacterium]|nr:hypothetical protein [Opitutaceae bacterium]
MWTFEVVESRKTRGTIHMVFPSAEEFDRMVKEFGAIEGAKQTLAGRAPVHDAITRRT